VYDQYFFLAKEISRSSFNGVGRDAVSDTFLAGMLATMVFVDVTKVMVGRLRPVFLEVCDVNVTLCYN